MKTYSSKSRLFAAVTLAILSATSIVAGNTGKANGQSTTQSTVESATSSKTEPYYVSVTLDDAFTQEFRIQSDESVCTGSKVGNTNWRIELEPHRNGDQSVSLGLKLGKTVWDKDGKRIAHIDSLTKQVRLTQYDEPRFVPLPVPFSSSWQIKKISVFISKKPGISSDNGLVAPPVQP